MMFREPGNALFYVKTTHREKWQENERHRYARLLSPREPGPWARMVARLAAIHGGFEMRETGDVGVHSKGGI
jgi:hypothetical protein